MPLPGKRSDLLPPQTRPRGPTPYQKQVLVQKAAQTTRPYPKPPVDLHRNPVAIRHFKHLVRQFHPDDFDNAVLLDYLVRAALLWSKEQELLDGLMNGSIKQVVRTGVGSQRRAPEFDLIDSYRRLYQKMIDSAGLRNANTIDGLGKARAAAARSPQKPIEGADVPAPPEKGKAMLSLLAGSKLP